jgi:hypothetical protein
MHFGKAWCDVYPHQYRNVSQLGSRIKSILVHLMIDVVLIGLAVANFYSATKEYNG